MPSTPYVINGTIKNSNSVIIADARITLTTTLGSVSGKTNSTGKYLLDLANAGYTSGETVTYLVKDKYNNQTNSGTFEVSGGGTTLNVTLAERILKVDSPGINDIQLHNIGGKPVSKENRLPVSLMSDGDYSINVQVDSSNGNFEYVGSAAIGTATSDALWKIKKINCTTGTVITYAGGSESFTNIFDNREDLSYS